MTDSHNGPGSMHAHAHRSLLQEAIDGALERLHGGGGASAVLLIDVDTRHRSGEPLLIALAQRLVAVLPHGDLVARFDGDVFVVVAREIADEGGAYELAAQLTAVLEAPLAGGEAACDHVSVGVSMIRAEDASVGAVIARADAAMYAARNRSSRDARGDDRSPESAREALVEEAFERSSIEDFDVYYQPIVDLRCGSVAAVEAILRWEHPDLGTVSPLEYLPIVERHGQMVTLGRHVIEKACAQTVHWAPTRDGLPMRTCVNVSASQIDDAAFVDDVLSALAHSGASAQQLALELSAETLAGMTAAVLRALQEARIELILDRFGTDAPARPSLGLLPIAGVKLDRAFVATGPDSGPPPILRETAEQARGLGLHAVAVGVETIDQLAVVRDSGFALGQGHLFSRPQSACAVEQLVQRERPFASLLAPRRAWLDLRLDGAEPLIEVGAPAVP